MTAYNRIKLKHALLKKDLFVVIGTIAGYHYSDNSKATHVYTTAGIFPCEETSEQINELIDATVGQYTDKDVHEFLIKNQGLMDDLTTKKTATAPTADTSVGALSKQGAK